LPAVGAGILRAGQAQNPIRPLLRDRRKAAEQVRRVAAPTDDDNRSSVLGRVITVACGAT